MDQQFGPLLYMISIWALPAIVAITFHEAAHGFAARLLGDDTAWRLGRVTFNPLRHIDPIGTILLPAVLLFLRSPFLFGYAKPVPINFGALRNPRRDMVLVAAAGPGINIVLAVIGKLATGCGNGLGASPPGVRSIPLSSWSTRRASRAILSSMPVRSSWPICYLLGIVRARQSPRFCVSLAFSPTTRRLQSIRRLLVPSPRLVSAIWRSPITCEAMTTSNIPSKWPAASIFTSAPLP